MQVPADVPRRVALAVTELDAFGDSVTSITVALVATALNGGAFGAVVELVELVELVGFVAPAVDKGPAVRASAKVMRTKTIRRISFILLFAATPPTALLFLLAIWSNLLG